MMSLFLQGLGPSQIITLCW